MIKLGKMKILARFFAHHGMRNTKLEDLHSGLSPSSKTGDFNDVKVISPYGEIPWNKLSRFNDDEMRELMLDVEKQIFETLLGAQQRGWIKIVAKEEILKLMKECFFGAYGVSWDIPQKKYDEMYKISGEGKEAVHA